MVEYPKKDKSGTDAFRATTGKFVFKDSLYPWLILPILTWMMFSYIPIKALSLCMPVWLAVPLGLLIGFVPCVIAVSIFGDGPSTLLEVNVGCAILLILGMILYPTYSHVQHVQEEIRRLKAVKAQRQHQHDAEILNRRQAIKVPL